MSPHSNVVMLGFHRCLSGGKEEHDKDIGEYHVWLIVYKYRV